MENFHITLSTAITQLQKESTKKFIVLRVSLKMLEKTIYELIRSSILLWFFLKNVVFPRLKRLSHAFCT